MSLKSLAISTLGHFPATSVGLLLSQSQPLVVLYHGVTTEIVSEGIRNYRKKHIYIDTFEQQIKWLSRNFSIVPLHDIEMLTRTRRTPQRPLCAITFDDGYENNYTNAFPILKKHAVPATIFVTTGFIEKKLALWPDIIEESIERTTSENINIPWNNGEKQYPTKTRSEKILADMNIRSQLKKTPPNEREKIIEYLIQKTKVSAESIFAQPDYAPLSWNEIAEMLEGEISIGAHTESHSILSTLSPEEQRNEILLSVKTLRSKIGHCEHFAYPNGQEGNWTEETKSILKGANIFCAWTTAGRRVHSKTDDTLELPRITLDNTEVPARFKGLVSNSIPFVKSLKK